MTKPLIHLPNGLIDELEQEAERHYPNETGGVLLGFPDKQRGEQVQIVKQFGPGPQAVHKPFRFEPDPEWQQEQIANAYEESGRILTYLGDWHSHPRGGSIPSSTDRTTAKKIARFREARLPQPLIMILHGGPEEWEVAAYRRQRWKLREASVFRQD